MTRRHWFLPESPDLVGMLQHQVEVTAAGMDVFAAWAGGDAAAGDRVRASEHQADAAKRVLLEALRAAFVTQLEPEDLFALSQGIDRILNHAKDAVGESEVMACPPDPPLAEMATLLAGATHQIQAAIAAIGGEPEDVDAHTAAAVKGERDVEHVYRRAMAALLEVDDLREVTARRELYRRMSRIGDAVAEVAQRVAYAVVKES